MQALTALIQIFYSLRGKWGKSMGKVSHCLTF